MNKYVINATLLCFLIIFITGCPVTQSTINLQSSLNEFLSANQASSTVQEAYLFSLDNPNNILTNVSCYCGCIQTHNHENARACFIENEIEQASGEYFDEMGLNCGECVDTVLTVKNLQEQGKSESEIKSIIDQTFKPNT